MDYPHVFGDTKTEHLIAVNRQPRSKPQTEQSAEAQEQSSLESDPQTKPDGDKLSRLHFGSFGRKGTAQDKRTTILECKTPANFKKPHQTPWVIPISSEMLLKLLHGYTSKTMEDKWDIYASGPDMSGAAKVYFYRSWTGQKVAELDLQVAWGDDAASELWEGRVELLTTESDWFQGGPKEDEEWIKFHILGVFSWVLDIWLHDQPLSLPLKWKAWIDDPGNSRHESVEDTMQQLSITPLGDDEPEPVNPSSKPVCYRGVSHSRETEEDIERLGGMQNIYLNTPAGTHILFG